MWIQIFQTVYYKNLLLSFPDCNKLPRRIHYWSEVLQENLSSTLGDG